MLKRMFPLFVPIVLMACTWSHPYKNEQEFYADKIECQQYAQGQTPQQQPLPPTAVAGATTKKQMGAVYGAQMGNSIGLGMQQGGYFRDCMRSKGYQ